MTSKSEDPNEKARRKTTAAILHPLSQCLFAYTRGSFTALGATFATDDFVAVEMK